MKKKEKYDHNNYVMQWQMERKKKNTDDLTDGVTDGLFNSLMDGLFSTIS